MKANRVCICIGCDDYDSIDVPNLSGCGKDAERIFALLTDASVGQNSTANSRLLKNPKSDDLRAAFGELAAKGDIDTLTIFFAGHGATKDSSYFLITNDTLPNRLSMTSLPIADLFMFAKEIKPRQVNILIDACGGAGLVNDLGTIVKSDILGAHSSMGVSMLVSSASDRNAGEDSDGGFVTNLVIDVLRGRIPNHSKRPFLSLAEVGNLVWESGSKALAQQPSVWALNVFGETALCKNPNAFVTEQARAEYVIRGLDVAELAGIGRNSGIIEPAAQIFLDLPRRFDSNAYRTLFQNIAIALDSDSARVEVALGLGDSLREKAYDAVDPFLPATISAAVLTSLLPSLSKSDDFQDQLIAMCRWFIDDVARASSFAANASENRFWLLSRTAGGILDLYFIPLRISMILGYIGAARIVADFLEAPRPFGNNELKVIENIADEYTMTMSCVNEAQAAYLLPFFVSCDGRNLPDLYEKIRGSFYNDIFSSKGFVGDYDLPPDKIARYLLCKESFDRKDFGYAARPNVLLTTLITEFVRTGDSELIRYDIQHFDGLHLNWYIPERQIDYAVDNIEGGRNFSAMIGHSLFTIGDIRDYWTREVYPFMRQSEGVESQLGQIGGLLASLVYSDRTPWFLINDILADGIEGHLPAAS
jgi:hypothetical protein